MLPRRVYAVRMRVFLALFFFTLPLLAQKKLGSCAVENLPSGVQVLLKTKYQESRPKALSDLEEYDQKLWLASNPHSCPGIAVGSFEEQHKNAYAVLLVPRSETEKQYRFVVFAQSQGSTTFHSTLLDHGENIPNSGLVISRVPPGKQTGFEEGTPVTLKLDGLNLEWLEKSSVLYYYSNGSYHQLQTSD